MWQVLASSLLFIISIAALFVTLASWKKKNPAWLSHLRLAPDLKPNKINIAERKSLSAQHSLLEIEWQGSRYLLHLGPSSATILDSKPTEQ